MSHPELESRLGHRFADPSILEQALTHSSYASEHPGVGFNERFEFLGDAVLQLVITEFLFSSYPELPEGKMAKIRAASVSGEELTDVARQLDLGPGLRLGKGEEASGGRDKDSILADAMEAVLAADPPRCRFSRRPSSDPRPVGRSGSRQGRFAGPARFQDQAPGDTGRQRTQAGIRDGGIGTGSRPGLHSRGDDRRVRNGKRNRPLEEARPAGSCPPCPGAHDRLNWSRGRPGPQRRDCFSAKSWTRKASSPSRSPPLTMGRNRPARSPANLVRASGVNSRRRAAKRRITAISSSLSNDTSQPSISAAGAGRRDRGESAVADHDRAGGQVPDPLVPGRDQNRDGADCVGNGQEVDQPQQRPQGDGSQAERGSVDGGHPQPEGGLAGGPSPVEGLEDDVVAQNDGRHHQGSDAKQEDPQVARKTGTGQGESERCHQQQGALNGQIDGGRTQPGTESR